MNFKETITTILNSSSRPLTPQEIRSIVKEDYPDFYGTTSHQINVQKGHYTDLDHALLAQLYSMVRNNDCFFCDTNFKPMKITLKPSADIKNKKKNIPSTRTPITNTDELILNLKHYYRRSLEVLRDFGGPSVHFHVQAIKEQKSDFLSERHIEMIYAVLTSWGMHKMGDPKFTKTKLVDYNNFKSSILNHRHELESLASLRIETCTQEEYKSYFDLIERIYYHLKVSISEATIVANSKTLAHILPDLIPPIDRQYTIRFFTQDYREFFTRSGGFKPVSLPQNIQDQFLTFKEYCCGIKSILDRCDSNLFNMDEYSFNTSLPKIIDNLIMAFVKDTPRPKLNKLH